MQLSISRFLIMTQTSSAIHLKDQSVAYPKSSHHLTPTQTSISFCQLSLCNVKLLECCRCKTLSMTFGYNMLSIKYLLYNTRSLLYHQIKSQCTSSAKILIGFFHKMLDIKPIFCQLSTSHISTDNFHRTYLSCPTSTFPKSSVSCVYNFLFAVNQ